MYTEIKPATHDGQPCHVCGASFRAGDRTMHITVSAPWTRDGRSATTVYCAECYRGYVDQATAAAVLMEASYRETQAR
jgi:hypothetical protein